MLHLQSDQFRECNCKTEPSILIDLQQSHMGLLWEDQLVDAENMILMFSRKGLGFKTKSTREGEESSLKAGFHHSNGDASWSE